MNTNRETLDRQETLKILYALIAMKDQEAERQMIVARAALEAKDLRSAQHHNDLATRHWNEEHGMIQAGEAIGFSYAELKGNV